MGADIDFPRVRTLLLLGLSLMSLGACSEKDPVCDDLSGLACSEVGLPAEHRAALCDECGTPWACSLYGIEDAVVIQVNRVGCECIDDNGCLVTNETLPGCGGPHGTSDTVDTGIPPAGTCDSD